MGFLDKYEKQQKEQDIIREKNYKAQEIRLGSLLKPHSNESVVSYISKYLKKIADYNKVEFSKTIYEQNPRYGLQDKDLKGENVFGCEFKIEFKVGHDEICVWLTKNHLDFRRIVVSQNDLTKYNYLFEIIFNNSDFKLEKDDFVILDNGVIEALFSDDILQLNNDMTSYKKNLKTVKINNKIWTSEDVFFESYFEAEKFANRIVGWHIPTTLEWESLFHKIDEDKQYDFVVIGGNSGLNLVQHGFYWGNDSDACLSEKRASRISTWDKWGEKKKIIMIQGGYIQHGLFKEHRIRLVKDS